MSYVSLELMVEVELDGVICVFHSLTLLTNDRKTIIAENHST